MPVNTRYLIEANKKLEEALIVDTYHSIVQNIVNIGMMNARAEQMKEGVGELAVLAGESGSRVTTKDHTGENNKH